MTNVDQAPECARCAKELDLSGVSYVHDGDVVCGPCWKVYKQTPRVFGDWHVTSGSTEVPVRVTIANSEARKRREEARV